MQSFIKKKLFPHTYSKMQGIKIVSLRAKTVKLQVSNCFAFSYDGAGMERNTACKTSQNFHSLDYTSV